MAKGVEKPPKLPKGANLAQTQEYLYKLFKQGHPPKLALEMLKSARNAREAMRATDTRSERDSAPQDGVRGPRGED